MLADGEPLFWARDAAAFWARVEQELMIAVANLAPHRVFVHCGVVGWRGEAFVFPGTSFSGKTTLVRALVQAGMSYYSDEYALFDRAGRVHPYPRALQVRKPGQAQQRKLPVGRLGGVVGRRSLPVTHVIFSQYRAGASWAPRLVPPGRAVLEMLRHTISVQRAPQTALQTLSVVMAKATAVKGTRGEVQQLIEYLLNAP